jgi:tetratricopeptide (TPR) repeat protein
MPVNGYFKKFVFIFLLLSGLCALNGCESKTRDQFYAEGLEQMNKGNMGGAVVLFRNALDKDLNFFDARYQLATAYTAMGKYEQAEKEFQKLSRQNPSHTGMKLGLAKVYILLTGRTWRSKKPVNVSKKIRWIQPRWRFWVSVTRPATVQSRLKIT